MREKRRGWQRGRGKVWGEVWGEVLRRGKRSIQWMYKKTVRSKDVQF